MSKNHSTSVALDNNAAAVTLAVHDNETNTKVFLELTPRMARSIAMDLLKQATDAEYQREANLRRVQESQEAGYDVSHIVEAQILPFTKRELATI